MNGLGVGDDGEIGGLSQWALERARKREEARMAKAARCAEARTMGSEYTDDYSAEDNLRKISGVKKVTTKSTVKPQAAKPAGHGLTFANAKNIEAPWLQVFIMGDMGSGKTKLASTFPRPLFLVPKSEQSMLTLKGLDFPYWEIDSMRGPIVNNVGGMLTAIQALETAYSKDPDGFPFDTIVVEQIGHYSNIVQAELTQGTMSMDQQKWGLHLRHFLDIQAKIRRMSLHLVWTSHTKIEKMTDTATISGANISGQASTAIPSSCDIVAYCDVGTGSTRRFKTHFSRYMGFNARSRLPLPASIENCTFEKMMACIEEGGAENA